VLGFELPAGFSVAQGLILRSRLFVPGSRPELFAKAMATGCDAVSFDLEDAVPDEKKADARVNVARFLRSARGHSKVTVVRINAVSSSYFKEDVAALADIQVDVINLPKVESGDDIVAVAKMLPERTCLLATIETPKGLRLAHEIAASHPQLIGLQIGYADLFGITGIDRKDAEAVAAVQLRVRFAAAEAGVEAYDGAFLDVRNLEGFRSEAEAARRHGLAGKSCIHPSQIAIANEVFSPMAEEIERARRIVAAADESADRGAFLVQGEMVDRPVIARARAIIALADRLGEGEELQNER
jgi:citrate lyase subunit beta/citryl-CoA lyase